MSLIDKGLENTIVTDSRKTSDDTMKENASAAENTGLEIRVSRRYDGVGIHGGKECQWCLDRCGEDMAYQEAMERGVFQRHPGCGCEIEYTSKKGKTTWQYQKGGEESWKDKQDKEFRKTYNIQNDRYIRKVPAFKGDKGLADYTVKEINIMAKETEQLVVKHDLNESLWSKRIIVNNEGKYRKEWNCDITTSRETSMHMLLHEQIHATSISHFDEDIYLQYPIIEESSVELMAIEISKKEGIIIVESGYEEYVEALRSINKDLKLFPDDYSFAKAIVKQDVPERLIWLDGQINAKMQSGEISFKKYKNLIKQLDKLVYDPK